MVYRYQEWQDGIHNFDNHMMLSLHLCLTLRNALQTHTAVSRVIGIIEATEGESFPNKEMVLQAYLSFEALSEHDYTYACVSCGYHPATVVMDLHKKDQYACEIQNPPQQYDGRVNVKDFWDAVTMEILSRGFYPSDGKNPFIVRPSYQNWAPWIGQHTRQSDIVFNTEYAKIHVPDVSTDADERVTEERLADEVLNLKVAEVRALCKQCSLDSKGSKMDLVLRLREKMASRTTYNKVFEKVLGASGGWAVVMCPCGVVYSVKFNLRAESARDFTDMLLSWKHFPNVTVYDYARGLASHANCRQPLDPPFHPHEGRLLHPSPENIKLAAERKLRLSQVSDSRGSPDERLADINNQILTHTDFWTLGRPQDVEGMILNSCLKVIEKLANDQIGIKVFSVNSYVAHTWFIPSVQNPEQHLPDKADDFQWILVPVWRPGHWTICVSDMNLLICISS
ncbi:hypothetical protein KUCAC02_012398 [Chaenocephalus aceratus]|uniref:Uncharacterized protein n=1 Tax=Chaenocephalus aceratus TaxID=36190 RepID=A0ACB9XBL5_CHAAC|nr:hypothetical protein KUCAC02_012398 [Chaenocephalus aceratus]